MSQICPPFYGLGLQPMASQAFISPATIRSRRRRRLLVAWRLCTEIWNHFLILVVSVQVGNNCCCSLSFCLNFNYLVVGCLKDWELNQKKCSSLETMFFSENINNIRIRIKKSRQEFYSYRKNILLWSGIDPTQISKWSLESLLLEKNHMVYLKNHLLGSLKNKMLVFMIHNWIWYFKINKILIIMN